MLTPQERMKMEELKNKAESYTPLTPSEKKAILDRQSAIANSISNEILLASEPWQRICNHLSLLTRDNVRLTMEIDYWQQRFDNLLLPPKKKP